MLKKYFLITFILSFFLPLYILFSQKWINISSNVPQKIEINLLNSNINSSTFEISIKGFYLNTIKNNNNEYTISVEGTTPILSAKDPDLPKVSVPLIIPDIDEMQVEVISNSYIDYYDINIAPSKGNLLRTINPDDIPYVYGDSYSINQFFPENLVALEQPYILRDFRAQTVKIYPFQYNPVTNTLRVYYKIKISLKSKSKNGENKFIRTKSNNTIDTDFDKIYARNFINYNTSKYTPLSEQGNMLIICYDNFIPAMQDFVKWKNLIGIPTELVAKSAIGNTATSIKNYVANYYNTKGLTYLLLVGDAAQIPTNSLSSGNSDNAYGYITGNDRYQEIFVGRFSAESLANVTTMVNRTVKYEKNPNTTPGLYNKVMGIASEQGPGDDNEYDYQHIRNMLNQMLNYTYTQKLELFDGSQGESDASGDPTASMVSSGLNSGVGCILYTGHGSQTSFVTSGFSNTDINNLNNIDKLPFIWSVACVNGDFVSTTCFAETWLRAGSGTNNPKGAIATLMSTINQSWNPPMCGQDEMVDILTETYPTNIKRTYGGISVNGLFKMNDEYGSQGYEMTDTWTIFGDPSLMVRTDDPATMNVSHISSLIIGATSLQINCNVDNAYVSLTINNNIIGTAYVSGGIANVTFPALTTTDSIHIAVTAFNYIPYIGGISVISSTAPYVNYKTHTINDINGNNNSKADYNESISLNVTLENSGASDANGVNAMITTSDPYITITKSAQNWGNIASGTQSTQNNAYALTIADNIPDQHIAGFTINIQDNLLNTWTNNFNIPINAPVLLLSDVTIDDATGGNNNHRLDPGESVLINIKTLNNGHSDAFNTKETLSTTNPDVNIINPIYNFGTINSANSGISTFSVDIASSAAMGSIANFTCTVSSGAYSNTKTFSLIIGQVDEDWETGNFNKFNWVQGGNKVWTISNVQPYEGVYCAKSGNIGNNQNSTLSITVNVSIDDSISFFRKVSSETDYDFLKFYIDNVKQNSWSGSLDWAKVSYPVQAGTHTFKWEYVKDIYYSGGSDCAWIDYILFPPIYNPSTNNNKYINCSDSITVTIYPNPATDILNINYFVENKGDVLIELFNFTGQKIITVSEESVIRGIYNKKIDVSKLSSGIYFCKININGNVSLKKIIIN